MTVNRNREELQRIEAGKSGREELWQAANVKTKIRNKRVKAQLNR